MGKISRGAKVIGIILKPSAAGHGNRLENNSVDMVWEFNRAMLEGRKNTTCHPLDRNRL
jgi:hypothetical protein